MKRGNVLETGIFPDDWKKAKVHPIFKSDERNIPSNYRPISILPAISKIIERVMHSQLLEYFQAGNLLSLNLALDLIIQPLQP